MSSNFGKAGAIFDKDGCIGQKREAEGCEAESSFDVDTVGTLAITVTPPTATITLGDTIGLSASGAPSFLWSPNESLSCTVCSAPLAWPQQTTTYHWCQRLARLPGLYNAYYRSRYCV